MLIANYITALNFIHNSDASKRFRRLYEQNPEGMKFTHSQITL